MNEDNPELRPRNRAPEQSERSAGADDPFDRLYMTWTEHALHKHQDPPSRERWDEIILRLISSQDPDRVRRYKRIEAAGEDTLGGDAYELWSKMPGYAANRSIPARTLPELKEYAAQHRGSMRRLMESKGLGEKYSAIIAAQKPRRSALSIDPEDPADKPRVRRSQAGVLVIGCAGMAAIAIMVLTVLLIIALRSTG